MSPTPATVGPYELERRLGAGGMAEAFLATRRGPAGFTQRVCLKRILPAYEEDADFVAMFLREARTSASLRHANIVQVLDFGVADGSHYLALELVDGMDLRALQDARRRQGDGRMEANLVALVAADLASALDVAHRPDDAEARPGIVHRDVSPGNVLVSRSGEVKLGDFGIARAEGKSHLTATGTVKGKVPYLAPEYLTHATFDARSDLFSLGVLLFELLAGKRPFDGETEVDTLLRITDNRRDELLDLAPTTPPELASCVERLLEPNPGDRFPSARELLLALPPVATHRQRAVLAEQVTGFAPPIEPVGLATTLASLSAPAPTPTRTAPTVPPTAQPARPKVGRGPRLALTAALLLAAATLGVSLLVDETPAWDPDRGAPAVPTEAPPAQPLAPRPLNPPGPAAPKSTPAEHNEPAAHGTPRGETDRPQRAQPRPPARAARQRRPKPAAAPQASIRVIALPFGDVWIDGVYRGASPLDLQLPAGEYRVSVGDGQERLRRNVTLKAGKAETILFKLHD